jgi:hypothetical protein
MNREDWVASPIDRIQKFSIQPGHLLKLERRLGGKGSRPESPLRWVVTGLEGDSVQLELEQADGVVSYTLKLRKLSETTLELRIQELTWTLNKI